MAPVGDTTPASALAGPSPSEASILATLQAGDDAGFEAIVRLYVGRCLGVARRILRNDDEAQDAVQDAFLSAWKSRRRFDGRSKFGTWLHRIVVNASLQILRKRKPAAGLSRHPAAGLSHHPAPGGEIEQHLPSFQENGMHTRHYPAWRDLSSPSVDRAEVHGRVRDAIERLPETHRVVLILRDIEGVDTAETAKLLSIKPNLVKVRLHRARQALRNLLEPHLRESLP